MTFAIGYKRIRHGSNEGAMLDEEIVEFCKTLGLELLEIFTDTFRSAVTDKNISGLKEAIQGVFVNKDCVLVTSTLLEMEENLPCVEYIIKTKVPMRSTNDPDMDVVSIRGFIHRAEKMIIHRREKHAQRIKRGHEHARRYGKKFGSKKILEAVKKASVVKRESGDAFRKKMIMPHIKEIMEKETPPVTLAMIKRGLEKRNIVTRTGSRTWHVTTIRNYLRKERGDE
jgi:hypothetical protein